MTRETILEAVQRAKGNVSKAARALGIHERRVYRVRDEGAPPGLCEIEASLRRSSRAHSLDQPVSAEEDDALGDLLPSRESGPADILGSRDQAAWLRSLLGQLPSLYREVLELRFGFENEGLTYVEIGKRLHLDRFKVGCIERRALDQLQRVAAD